MNEKHIDWNSNYEYIMRRGNVNENNGNVILKEGSQSIGHK